MLIHSLHSMRSPAVATEGLDEALRESDIPMSDLVNALASKPQRRRPAPAPAGGVTKARQGIPGLPKARQRKDSKGQPLKRTAKACVDCRYVFGFIPQDNTGSS